MYVCICMYVYVCMYMYACMYVFIYVCMYVCICMCVYVCICAYVCIHVCMCVHNILGSCPRGEMSYPKREGNCPGGIFQRGGIVLHPVATYILPAGNSSLTEL